MRPRAAAGGGIFLQGSGTATFSPGASQTQTVSDVIADQAGSGGAGLTAQMDERLALFADYSVILHTGNTGSQTIDLRLRYASSDARRRHGRRSLGVVSGGLDHGRNRRWRIVHGGPQCSMAGTISTSRPGRRPRR
jgi:hypothetical protein